MQEVTKQIEEIARLCCRPCEMESGGKCLENLDPTKCYIATEAAKAIYNADYRKERQGEWSGIWVYTCSACCSESKDRTKYCPNCGAKMEGGEKL